MPTVATVTGPIDAADLGFTLPAEHLWADFSVPDDLLSTWHRLGLTRPTAARERAFYEAPVAMGNISDINLGRPNRHNEQLTDSDRMVAEIERFSRFGGRTLVDVTPIDAGRNPSELRRLATRTGARILMATGWRSAAWAPALAARSAETIATQLISDIDDGVDGVHAALVALTEPLDPSVSDDAALIRAGALAAARTGVPLLVTAPGDLDAAGRVLDLAAGAGLPLPRVAIAGLGALTHDPSALGDVLARGANVLFESIGRIPTVYTRISDHQIALALIALDTAGYRGQLLVSPRHRARVDQFGYGGTGFAFVAEQLERYLVGLGGDPALVPALTCDNTARFLGRQEA